MAAQWVRSWNAVVWQFSCSWCKAAAGCKNTAQRVGKRVRNYIVWESKGTHRFFRRNLLIWDRKLITCDRNLLTCDRSLLTCDRSLLTCDRNLHAICGPRGVSAFCACVTFCKKKNGGQRCGGGKFLSVCCFLSLLVLRLLSICFSTIVAP